MNEASKIKSIFSSLNTKDKGRLIYAQLERISQFVEYSPGNFIGCYCEHITYLRILEHEGDWSIGTINANAIKRINP